VNWQELALCAQVDPDLWFPEKGVPSRAAVRICNQCPVRAECLAEAQARPEIWGVWGGLSYHQRLELRAEPGQVAA
jgi:WhiB family redox-sensing transcriptional regulator